MSTREQGDVTFWNCSRVRRDNSFYYRIGNIDLLVYTDCDGEDRVDWNLYSHGHSYDRRVRDEREPRNNDSIAAIKVIFK